MVDARKGKMVACLFSEDGSPKWFRARIEGRKRGEGADAAPAKTAEGLEVWEVTFVDYGNRDAVTVQSMRPLDAALSAIPPLARPAALAFIRVPPLSAEYGNEAASLLSDLAYGVRLNVTVHGKDFASDRALVSLTNPEDGSCVNEIMIREGVARVSSKEARRIRARASNPRDVELLAALEAAAAAAKAGHVGMYQYGDVGASDDERK